MRMFYALFMGFALSAAPPLLNTSTQDARTAYSKGLEAQNRGNLAEARDFFAQAAQAAPGWGLAYLQWGILEQSLIPESEQAWTALKKATTLEPTNARAQYHLGLVLRERKSLQEAMAAFEQALKLRPEFIDAAFALASVAAEANQLERASEAYGRVLSIDPYHSGALLASADIAEKLGRVELAERQLVVLSQSNPKAVAHRLRLAEFYERVGRTDKAKQTYAEVERLDPRRRKKMRELRAR